MNTLYTFLLSIFYRTAFLVIDAQFDFMPKNAHFPDGGSLSVTEGDLIIPVINQLRAWLFEKFKAITVFSQDWHPADHVSFQRNNEGSTLFQPWKLASGEMQMMWPAHCVQGTPGAQIHPSIYRQMWDWIFQKGTKGVDSYSAFGDPTMKVEDTGLLAYLLSMWVYRVVVAGIATDYCVKFTALHAQEFGFKTYVVLSGCRGVGTESTTAAIEEMRNSHLDSDGKHKIVMRTGLPMHPIIIVTDLDELKRVLA
jgi:nicotinamidase/pyrazinamidase